MSLYDYRKLIDLHPVGTYAAIECTEPGRIRLALGSPDDSLEVSLSFGDAGVIFDALAEAMRTAEAKSAASAEGISVGLLASRTGVDNLEPPC